MFDKFDLCLTVADAIKIEGLPYEVLSLLEEWVDKAFKCPDNEYEELCSKALDTLLEYGVGDKWSRELILLWGESGGDPENRLGFVKHAFSMSSMEELPLSGKTSPKRIQRSAVPSKKKVLSGGLGSIGRDSGNTSGLFGAIRP